MYFININTNPIFVTSSGYGEKICNVEKHSHWTQFHFFPILRMQFNKKKPYLNIQTHTEHETKNVFFKKETMLGFIHSNIFFKKRPCWAMQVWMAICHSLVTERLPALITVAMLCHDSQVYFSIVFSKGIILSVQLKYIS